MKVFLKLTNLAELAAKNVVRHRTRSLLTLLGVGTGMFLFTSIETMQQTLHNATVVSAEDSTLVVYRENRFCPATSRLPEHYQNEISRVAGVKSVTPVQIVVNNCGTSLDVVVFRGVPSDTLKNQSSGVRILDGTFENWEKRTDATLIGKNLANRRNLHVGDSFDAAGITVQIAGIIETLDDSAQNDNVAFVHLSFLQQASRIGLGLVTQFNVKVEEPSMLKRVANEIDERFSTDTDPTSTQPEKAFFANTAMELIELIRFSRWIGLACVIAIIGLVANTILLTVNGKIAEHAVLKTLGYSKLYIGWMVLCESIFLSFFGGTMGIICAFCYLHFQSISIGNEGLVLAFIPTQQVLIWGVFTAIGLGLLAGLYPAWKAGTHSISESLKVA